MLKISAFAKPKTGMCNSKTTAMKVKFNTISITFIYLFLCLLKYLLVIS